MDMYELLIRLITYSYAVNGTMGTIVRRLRHEPHINRKKKKTLINRKSQ